MDSPKLVVLDVGHGNSAVLHDSKGLVVFDAGLGSTLDEYLQDSEVRKVVALLISHSDADHLAGASNILLSDEIQIETVYMNPDADQKSVAFIAFRRALASSIRKNGTQLRTELTTATAKSITAGEVTIEILAPGPSLALAGNSGSDLKGRKIRSNTMSAVVRISLANRHAALLAGDIDEIALEHLLEETADVTAETLVFPHHGGRPGAGDPTVFASLLANAVAPELILFSTGRGKKNVNPHPAIVAALLQAAPSAHIGCTQLSIACSASTPLAGKHLSPLTAAGTEAAKCCIGTVEINLAIPKDFFPVLREHLEFVQNNAPTALCLNRGGSLPQ